MTITRFTGRTAQIPGGKIVYGVFDVTRVNPTLRTIHNRQQAWRQYHRNVQIAETERLLQRQQRTNLTTQLSQITSQYTASLTTLNRLFDVQGQQFGPRRQRLGAETELVRRKGLRDIGKVRASFGGRGISRNSSLLASAQREAGLLDQIQQSKLQSLELEEKETGIRQDKARQDLRSQFDNRKLRLQGQIGILNTRIQRFVPPLQPGGFGLVTTQSLGVAGIKHPQITAGQTFF